jgi:hypothetical protein
MQSTSFLGGALMTLIGQSPAILAYLIGMFIALVNLRRCATPAMLTFIACSILMLLAIVQPVMTQWIIQSRSHTAPGAEIARAMASINVVTSVIRACGVGMLIAAVFTGRSSPSNSSGLRNV